MEIKKPTQCFLWKKDNLTFEDLHYQNFDLLETFYEEDHFSRRLIKCKECGQLYLKEFYETTDYLDGNDPQYITIVPVQSREEAAEMAQGDLFVLSQHTPRLVSDFPKEADKPTVMWIGK